MTTTPQYARKSLPERARWYAPAAEAYARLRPSYPDEIIQYVLEAAALMPGSRLLELGCGPGTATGSLAATGCDIVALEPNPTFCEMARKRCARFANVRVQNTSFEAWSVEEGSYIAVVAASSFHWLDPVLAPLKIAEALRPGGHLVLLWNKLLPLPEERWQILESAFHAYAPQLIVGERDEALQDPSISLRRVGQPIPDSGLFREIGAKTITTDLALSADDYVGLLSTYSQYLSLGEDMSRRLFDALRNTIDDQLSGTMAVSFLTRADVYATWSVTL